MLIVTLAVWIVIFALPGFRGWPIDWPAQAQLASERTHDRISLARPDWTPYRASIAGAPVQAYRSDTSKRPTRYRVTLESGLRLEWRTLAGLRTIARRCAIAAA